MRLHVIVCALASAILLLAFSGCHETSEAEMIAFCRAHHGVRSIEPWNGGGGRVICLDGTVRAWGE